MRTSLALSWRNLLRTINPPLPLTPRDSSKMLGLLDKSFRKQIDKAYGDVDQHVVGPHMQSLLDNPTMNAQELRPKSRSSKTDPMKTIGDPVERLKASMSQGSATDATVKSCLREQLAKSRRCPDPVADILHSGAADALMHWLWASGEQRSLSFLSDDVFTSVIVKTLVAGGRRDQVMKWIYLANKKLSQNCTALAATSTKARLLYETIGAEVQLENVQSALALFLDKVKFRAELSSQQREHRRIFGPSAQYLMHKILDRVQDGTLDVSHYDLLQESLPLWSPAIAFESALIALNHPTQPNADLVFDYVRSLTKTQLARLPPHRRTATADMALKAAEEFMKQEKHSKVAAMLRLLKASFADVIGYREAAQPASQRPEATEERQQLELLDSLALG